MKLRRIFYAEFITSDGARFTRFEFKKINIFYWRTEFSAWVKWHHEDIRKGKDGVILVKFSIL